MSDFGKKIQQHRQFWVSFCLKNLFQEEVFFLKKNKQIANCLKIPREIFKSGEKLRTTDKNASAWLEKLDSVSPQVFVKENCLFFGEWLSSKTLFRAWVDVFLTSAKNSQQIVKFVSLSVQRRIFRRKFFLKKINSLINFRTTGGVFLERLEKKNWFLAKTYQHSCHKYFLYFQRDILGEKCFPKKK